jgi:hypothetical protein
MDGVMQRLDVLESKIDAITMWEVSEEEIMSEIGLRITNLRGELAENRSAVDSARTLIGAMRTDIQAVRDELSRRGVSEEDLAALDSIATDLDVNTDDLAEAVAENTDAEADGTDTTTNPVPTDTTPETDVSGAPASTEGGVDTAPMGGTTFENTQPDV